MSYTDPRTAPAEWLTSLGLTLTPDYAKLLGWVLDRAGSPEYVLDVGYGWGASTCLWLQQFPGAWVTTVDPLGIGEYANHRPTNLLAKAERDRWDFVHGKLEIETATVAVHGPFDFIYLDADHEYDSTVAQLGHCWEMLNPGGVLAGHDYYSFRDKVGAAVDEFVAWWELELEVTDLDCGAWLIRKDGEE